MQFRKKAVENPSGPDEILLDKTLSTKLSSPEYGACFLGMLIERFEAHGHDFGTPESVKIASNEYISENDVLRQFIDAAYDRHGDVKIALKDVWEDLKADISYFDQLGMKMSRELSQKLKNMGFKVYTLGGSAYVRGLRTK